MLKSLCAMTAVTTMESIKAYDIIKFNKEENNNLSVIETDILVVGGGTSGIVAAIQAARNNCKTILLESGSQLGGTMVTGGVSFPGLFHAWGKQIISGIGWELVIDCIKMGSGSLPDFEKSFGRFHSKHQIYLNPYLYTLLAEEKCLMSGVKIRYYETPIKITKRYENKWCVEISGKGVHKEIICKQLIDCTGNGLVAAMAGYSLLTSDEKQPGSLLFTLEGYDVSSLNRNIIERKYREALKNKQLLKEDSYYGIWNLLTVKPYLSTQHVINADSSTSELHTQTNIDGRASMLRIIRFVRSLPGCENAVFKKIQPEVAVRETNRIDGEYIITYDDYVSGRLFEDSLAYSYYPIDLHTSSGVKPQHLSQGKVATIPYRSLIPKGSTNLLVAGRCVSSDRLANSALRVQASCMAMGQIAGCAASLACINNTPLLNVPIDELKFLIKKHKGIVPELD